MMADSPTTPTQERPKRLRTMAELAKLAGVSPGTVSRALAGKSLVNDETRKRIQELARLHGFRPNQMAAKLRTQRTGVIGVVIPLGHDRRQHISDPFFLTLLGHLADELTESGYDLMLSRVVPDDEEWLDRIVDSGMLDGVLVIGQSDQVATIEQVADHYRPMVVWGDFRQAKRHCCVGTDNRAGGEQAAAHLIAQGRRKLLFVGDIRPPEIEARYAGACAAADAAGIARPAILPTHLGVEEIEADIVAHIDQLGDDIDGIIAASDVIAMTVLRVLADRNVRVPDDVALTGFDDLILATQTVPRLTTIRQDLAGGAKAMVQSLFARIAGESTPSVTMPPELIVRDSA